MFVVLLHDAGRHSVLLPGKAHAFRLTPSQNPLQPVSFPPQAGREPTGLPDTGVHVPRLAARLHASHWPAQALLQQTPSAQNVDKH
jgi:hypothetical protein